MGIRSDVGIVIHRDSANEFSKQLQASKYWDDFLPAYQLEMDRLYILEHVKWDPTFKDVVELVDILETLPEDHYYLVESCPEYPETGEEMGCYIDNPFDLRVERTSELYFEVI